MTGTPGLYPVRSRLDREAAHDDGAAHEQARRRAGCLASARLTCGLRLTTAQTPQVLDAAHHLHGLHVDEPVLGHAEVAAAHEREHVEGDGVARRNRYVTQVDRAPADDRYD